MKLNYPMNLVERNAFSNTKLSDYPTYRIDISPNTVSSTTLIIVQAFFVNSSGIYTRYNPSREFHQVERTGYTIDGSFDRWDGADLSQ